MLLYLDLETTGLDPKNDAVLEVAAIVMSDDLRTEISRFSSVIAWDATKHKRPIDPYVVAMHTHNGLWAECLAAKPCTAGFGTRADIDSALYQFLTRSDVWDYQAAPVVAWNLAGNSIHFDREFMREWFPLSFALLHHRQLDVSSLNELARRVWPDVHAKRPGAGGASAHRAMADAEQSIAITRHYVERLADHWRVLSDLTPVML